MNKVTLRLLLLMITICSLANPAQAYLDPNNGGMILQMLIGGLAGALVLMKTYWQQLMGFFRNLKTNKSK